MAKIDRKSTRLNSSHTVIYTLSLHDALPIYQVAEPERQPGEETDLRHIDDAEPKLRIDAVADGEDRSEEHTSELQSHRDLHSFPTRRSSDLPGCRARTSAR